MKKFFYFAALISALCLCLSSCDKETYYYDEPNRPGQRPGNDDNNGNNGNGEDNGDNDTNIDPDTFEVETGVDGTGMSYDSWIEINGQKTHVTLKATTANINTEIEVSTFELGNKSYNLRYSKKNSTRNQNITVTDSLMQYAVIYDNFNFNYDLLFQTARYDDGKVRQRMASLRFSENVISTNPTITDLTAQTIGGFVYARKLYRHSIKVSFNGTQTTVTANIILKRKLGREGEVLVIGSELHSSGIKDVRHDGNLTFYTSWIKVKQESIDGSIDYKTYEVVMKGSMVLRNMNNTVNSANISKISAGFDDSGRTSNVPRDRYIFQYYTERVYTVKYNQFTAKADIVHSTATYDDGISTIEFPNYPPENISDSYSMKLLGSHNDEHGSYKQYEFTFKLVCKFGNQQHQQSESFDVIIPQ